MDCLKNLLRIVHRLFEESVEDTEKDDTTARCTNTKYQLFSSLCVCVCGSLVTSASDPLQHSVWLYRSVRPGIHVLKSLDF